MKRIFAAVLLLAVSVVTPAVSAGVPAIAGTWEAARAPNGDRLFIVLGEKGKAEIVEEYQLPQRGKQRMRTSTYGKWVRKGNDVLLTYADITDRLRYVAREPLAAVGLIGNAPALRPAGKPDARSRIGAEVLWKAPHDYHMKGGEEAPVSTPEAGGEATNK